MRQPLRQLRAGSIAEELVDHAGPVQNDGLRRPSRAVGDDSIDTDSPKAPSQTAVTSLWLPGGIQTALMCSRSERPSGDRGCPAANLRVTD
jgi:hypothetical protein